MKTCQNCKNFTKKKNERSGVCDPPLVIPWWIQRENPKMRIGSAMDGNAEKCQMYTEKTR